MPHFSMFFFFFSCMRHQIEGAKDSCHRARSSEPSLRSAVTPACLTCRASLASRPPPHSGEHAKSSRVCSAEAFLHIPHICLWFTEQVTSPACLNSCFVDDAPLPPSPTRTFHLLTGEVWRPLARRSLSGSPLPAEPSGDLMRSPYWGPYE